MTTSAVPMLFPPMWRRRRPLDTTSGSSALVAARSGVMNRVLCFRLLGWSAIFLHCLRDQAADSELNPAKRYALMRRQHRPVLNRLPLPCAPKLYAPGFGPAVQAPVLTRPAADEFHFVSAVYDFPLGQIWFHRHIEHTVSR